MKTWYGATQNGLVKSPFTGEQFEDDVAEALKAYSDRGLESFPKDIAAKIRDVPDQEEIDLENH